MSQAIHACHFLKNFVARGSQGFVGQSSPNVAHIVEEPSMLNKFIFRITIFCRVQAWEQKVCGWVAKICQIETGTIRKLGCGLLFAFYSNCGSILHQFRDKARYWSKIVIFSYGLVFDAPVRGFPSEYCHPVWYRKTSMMGLSDGKKLWGYV